MKPVYQPTSAISIDQEALQRQGTKKFSRKALSELNTIYKEQASISFTNALVKDRSIGKNSQYEKKEKRKIPHEFVENVNESIAENTTITLLTEVERARHRGW